jgi:nicotinate-nucleotide adenylyltransferase
MHSRGVILFGGSFDPVHHGHLAMADFATNYFKADKVIFVPAARSPHKAVIPSASGKQRLEMIRLAIAGSAQREVNDCELNRSRPSYTIDTIRYFRSQYGSEIALYWLVGADAVPDLLRWHRIEELLDLCRVCILYRGGFEVPCLRELEGQLSSRHIEQLRRDVIPTPLMDISSTKIRQQIALGQEVENFLSPAVWDFIRQNRLYGYGTSPKS